MVQAFNGGGDEPVRTGGVRSGGTRADRVAWVAEALGCAVVVDEQGSAAPLQQRADRLSPSGRPADGLEQPRRRLGFKLMQPARPGMGRLLDEPQLADGVVDALVGAADEPDGRQGVAGGSAISS
jgi:hypothetical protein